MHEILLSFVGNRDPYADSGPESGDLEPGPVLSLLQAREFTRAVLFCTGASYVERARMVEQAVVAEGLRTRFNYVSMDLESPVDYQEIYAALKRAVDQFLPTVEHLSHRISVLLDPGTPQMQTAWFLLVASGYITADLLQGVPPKFAGGAYKVRTVELSGEIFPGLEIRGSGDRHPESASDAHEVIDADSRPTHAVPIEPSQWIRSTSSAIIGESPEFKAVVNQAVQVARYDISVVVRGETGTGKELIARQIHASSPRAGNPFVAVNCAAITASLAESEFFGHEKGAFTGADRNRLGKFRAADGGTVFLDEVGDLSREIQAKLLRVLEDRTLVPVGSDKHVSVDVRIIAATNRDLEALVEQEVFRRDLFQRLAQVVIEIPPLRERRGDIPLLLDHFVKRWNEQYAERKGLAAETIDFLIAYPWPGNVRELANAVKATCAMGRSAHIVPELLPPAILAHFNRDKQIASIPSEIPEDGLDLRALMHNLERDFYQEALRRTDGNAEQAARLLGLNGAAFRKAARERLDVTYRDSV